MGTVLHGRARPLRFLRLATLGAGLVERGDQDGFPLFILHGGPGLDHHMFGDYLDSLGDRYRLLLVDGDPLTDIAAAERISHVVYKGERIRRGSLLDQK